MRDTRLQSIDSTSEHIHETYDLRLRSILTFAGGLVVLCIVSMVGLRLGLIPFVSREKIEETVRPARLEDQSGQYRGPNLQENPYRDRTDIRVDELQRLNSYAYDDQGLPTRIPIDTAIEILAKKGLPTRESAPAKSETAQPKGTP